MNDRRKVLLIILVILLVVALGVGGGWFAWYWTSGNVTLPVYRGTHPTTTTATSTTAPADPQTPSGSDTSSPDDTTTSTTVPLVDNPVDFKTLQATNPDIYAWLYVPGTMVDYPVACASDQADGFYLDHNIYREYEYAGTIYSEKKNGTEMLHRNTVMYGHNMMNNTMFGSLHDFEDEEFFNAHDVMYVYTPGHIYTYKIFAAYEYDNRHLLNSFDFYNDEVWAEYLAYATNPQTMTVNTRDVPVTIQDRILTLSTCVGWNKNVRYLVQGVLIDDQPTRT